MSTSVTVGRLNPAFIDMFCNLLSHGNYIQTACKLMRIPESTFQSWMRIGKQAEFGIHREFYERVLQADASAEAYALETVKKHFDRDWRAGMTFLARRFPDRWSERRYIKLAVDREVEQMLKDLQQRLPEDVFMLVMNELASIEQEHNTVEMVEEESR
jgi:hypothetical protein